MTMKLLAIFIGGGLGSILRYGISRLTASVVSTGFPLGTLLANVISCILLGAGMIYLLEKQMQGSAAWMFLIVGFCGGFSTFSTFSFETFDLVRGGHAGLAIANVMVSVLLCLSVVWWMLRTQP